VIDRPFSIQIGCIKR